jgi:hypothetical protein
MNESKAREDLFWDLAQELYGDPAVTRSTMMGYPCLRADGAFFASLERGAGHLILKLSRDRVAELIADGVGLPFAPNGRVFREWVAVPTADEDQWRALLAEAKALATNG